MFFKRDYVERWRRAGRRSVKSTFAPCATSRSASSWHTTRTRLDKAPPPACYQWERQHEVDVFVARLPQGSDPAELAQRDPAALVDAVATAVPFLQFRLDRVLDAANLSTAEGRARNAEAALRVLAEHPSDLVRDQYLLKVADALRLDLATLRPRVSELVRNPQARAPVAERAPQPRVSEPLPRPGSRRCVSPCTFPTT